MFLARLSEIEKGEYLLMSLESVINIKDIKRFARFYGLKDNVIDVIQYNCKSKFQSIVKLTIYKMNDNLRTLVLKCLTLTKYLS